MEKLLPHSFHHQSTPSITSTRTVAVLALAFPKAIAYDQIIEIERSLQPIPPPVPIKEAIVNRRSMKEAGLLKVYGIEANF